MHLPKTYGILAPSQHDRHVARLLAAFVAAAAPAAMRQPASVPLSPRTVTHLFRLHVLVPRVTLTTSLSSPGGQRT